MHSNNSLLPFLQPLNDQCDGAEDLGFLIDGQLLGVEGSTIGALNDSDESPLCGVEMQRGVWYKLNIAFPAEVMVYACQESQKFQVVAYSGTCGLLICQVDVNSITGCQQMICLIENAIPSDVYIHVEGINGNTGRFLWTCQCQ